MSERTLRKRKAKLMYIDKRTRMRHCQGIFDQKIIAAPSDISRDTCRTIIIVSIIVSITTAATVSC